MLGKWAWHRAGGSRSVSPFCIHSSRKGSRRSSKRWKWRRHDTKLIVQQSNEIQKEHPIQMCSNQKWFMRRFVPETSENSWVLKTWAMRYKMIDMVKLSCNNHQTCRLTYKCNNEFKYNRAAENWMTYQGNWKSVQLDNQSLMRAQYNCRKRYGRNSTACN